MPSSHPDTKILIVEDEHELANLYADHLEDDYAVKTAYNGTQALNKLDWRPDIVLLDRKMPGMSGDEVLGAMQEQGLDPMVAMVTAVDPDADIIDARIDEYLVKPISRDTLIEAVEQLMVVSDIGELKRELSAKKVKRNVLRVEKTERELRNIDEFGKLEDRIDELESHIEAVEGSASEKVAEKRDSIAD